MIGKLRKHLWFIVAAVIAVGLDRWTKLWVQTNMALFESREVIGDLFRLSYIKNAGIAFGMFASSEHALVKVILMFLALVAIGFVVYIYAISKKSVLEQLSLGFILGGAFGNIFDRFIYRQVVDFLDFGIGRHRFYTFNLADSAIILGLILLLLQVLMEERKEKGKNAEKEEDPAADKVGEGN